MKVAVLNLSGNVGKTTVSAHLLKPRMASAPIFSIETINQGADADGLEVEKMQGKTFGALIDELMGLDTAIIDVGASNIETFLKLMTQYDGSHEEFVPVVKEKKVQADTVNTIRMPPVDRCRSTAHPFGFQQGGARRLRRGRVFRPIRPGRGGRFVCLDAGGGDSNETPRGRECGRGSGALAVRCGRCARCRRLQASVKA